MKTRIHHSFHFTALAACGLALGACQSNKHMMTDAATGKTIVCQECYDAVTKEHRAHPTLAANENRTIRTYQCPCCKTEMSVYIQDGTHMVRCGGCAREGIAWDKCTPPSTATK
jgi:hypothetical protein